MESNGYGTGSKRAMIEGSKTAKHSDAMKSMTEVETVEAASRLRFLLAKPLYGNQATETTAIEGLNLYKNIGER